MSATKGSPKVLAQGELLRAKMKKVKAKNLAAGDLKLDGYALIFFHFPEGGTWINEPRRAQRVPAVGEYVARHETDTPWRVVLVHHHVVKEDAKGHWATYDAEVYCENARAWPAPEVVAALKTGRSGSVT